MRPAGSHLFTAVELGDGAAAGLPMDWAKAWAKGNDLVTVGLDLRQWAGPGGNGVMGQPLKLDREAIAALCRRFGVTRLAIFGSAVTDRFDPARSDVDFLVEFAPESASLDTYFGLKQALVCCA